MINLENFFEDWSACPVPEEHHSFDGLFSLLKANQYFEGRNFSVLGQVSPQAILADKVSVGENTVIEPFVIIEDNVVIGKNCLIRSGALIRSGTIIGDNCVIGHSSEVKNAIIFNEAKVASLCFAGDCVLGKGARLGSGTITGNRRFDQKEIAWLYEDQKIPTDLEKLGCFIGDYARLGAGVITAPGVMIGKYSWIPGNAVISGYIPPSKFVKMRVDYEMVDNKTDMKLAWQDKEGHV